MHHGILIGNILFCHLIEHLLFHKVARIYRDWCVLLAGIMYWGTDSLWVLVHSSFVHPLHLISVGYIGALDLGPGLIHYVIVLAGRVESVCAHPSPGGL